MTYLWAPPGWGGTKRVRRNPQASLYQPVLEPDDWGYDNTITPNGIATLGAVDVASASEALHKAGTRGAAALGALAGVVVTFSWKGAAVGGVLGYLGGKFLANLADKALAVVASTKGAA